MALAKHSDFTIANPNRLRALVGALAVNQRAFHDASGAGYRFLADTILAVDKLNPQTAAKLVPPLGRWRRFGEDRAGLMRAELERLVESERDLQLIDVRQPGEASKGVIPGAVEIPLTRLNERLSTLDASKPTVVYCAGGYRSSIAASRMAAAGFADVADLLGGYGAWSVATAR